MSFHNRKNALSQKDLVIDYKELRVLRRCVTENGKMMPARMTGFSRSQQKRLKSAVENARFLALLPYTVQ
jgi:small subunit ribosomal protein S18